MPLEAPQPPGPSRPSVAATVEYCGLDLGEDGGRVQGALAAETAAQNAVCRTDPYTDDLAEALLRRVQRNLEMRNLPLGVQQSDTGGTAIGTYDPEVRRLERPYRRLVCA